MGKRSKSKKVRFPESDVQEVKKFVSAVKQLCFLLAEEHDPIRRVALSRDHFTPDEFADGLARMDILLCGVESSNRTKEKDAKRYEEFVRTGNPCRFGLTRPSSFISLSKEPRFFAPDGSPWNKIISSIRYRASVTQRFNQAFGTHLH